MADGEERLVILLEARIRDLEKIMAKASGVTAKTYRGMSRDSASATRAMEQDMIRSTTRINQALATTSGRIGTFGKAFAVGAAGSMKAFAVGAIASMLSVSRAVAGARRALDEYSKVQDAANSTGLDSEFLQELAFAAEQGGVGFEALAGALGSFNKNAGLAVVNKGKMATALKVLNPELLASIKAATTQEERVRLAADAIAKAGSASERAALSVTLFGDAGTELVEVFRAGNAGIDTMARKARDLGIVIDRDLISRSEALGDELSAATNVMDVEFSQALVNLAPLLVSSARLAGDLASAIRQIVDGMKGLGGKSAAGLNEELAMAEANLARHKEAATGDSWLTYASPAQVAGAQAEVDKIRREMVTRALDDLRPALEQHRAMAAGERTWWQRRPSIALRRLARHGRRRALAPCRSLFRRWRWRWRPYAQRSRRSCNP